MFKHALLALGLLAAPLAHGQQPEKIKTLLVTYALGGPKGGFKAFFKSGEEIVPFAANSGGLGAPFQYEGPRRLVIRESKEAFNPPPEGQQPKPPLAFVDLPEKADNVLIIAADSGGGKFRLVAYDVATNNLKGGDYLFFNFSHFNLSFIMGKQKFALAPAENKLVRDPSWINPDPQTFPIKIATVNGKDVVLAREALWEHWPDKRNVVFLFDGIAKGEPVKMVNFNVEKPIRLPAAQPEAQ